MNDELERRATAFLEVEPPTVVRKQVLPESRDVHDYYSIAPYWWPNPETDDGLPWVERDGFYNERTLDIPDKPGIYRLIEMVWVLGHAYAEGGRIDFARKAGTCLRAWFLNSATRMNPNLNHAQSVPGIASGRPAGLIEFREIGKLLDGAQLIEGSAAWTREDGDRLRDWMDRFLDWQAASPLAQAERDALNNHATWYRAQAAAILDFVGKSNDAREMVAGARELIDRQIRPDGTQPHELKRANSRHYSLFNVLGFCRLAEFGDRLGVDLWSHSLLFTAIERLIASWNDWPYPTLPPMATDDAEYDEVVTYARTHYHGERCAAC